MLLVQEHAIEQVVGTDGVDRGHDNLGVRLSDWDLELLLSLHPVDPTKLLWLEADIE